MSREQQLIDFCSAGFPYVCAGEKQTRADGSVACECGTVTKPADPDEVAAPAAPIDVETVDDGPQPEAVPLGKPVYSLDVITAACRVGAVFARDCDRCDLEDLLELEHAGLMYRDVTEVASDTLVEGEEAWFFTAEGEALVAVLQAQY